VTPERLEQVAELERDGLPQRLRVARVLERRAVERNGVVGALGFAQHPCRQQLGPSRGCRVAGIRERVRGLQRSGHGGIRRP
jgi:hypothetical protein